MEPSHSENNQWSDLLRKAAEEIRNHSLANPGSSELLFKQLSSEIEQLALLQHGIDLEQRIHSAARKMIDECPLSSDFAPSFQIILGALQRLTRKRKTTNQKLSSL